MRKKGNRENDKGNGQGTTLRRQKTKKLGKRDLEQERLNKGECGKRNQRMRTRTR